jgi:hypothetical protein
MSRLLLLSILVLWMCPRDNVDAPPWSIPVRLAVFLGVYTVLVGVMAAWSRRLASRVADDLLGRTLDRYNKGTELARYFIPAWFAVGIFALGWGHIVYGLLSFMEPHGLTRHHVSPSEPYWRIPGMLVGTLPAFIAWMGLWWAQYPADRALKEQSVLYQANEGLPIHAPVGFGTFFVEHFRQQLLFTLAPVVLIVSARDLMAVGYLFFAAHPLGRDGGDLIILPLAIAIFASSPPSRCRRTGRCGPAWKRCAAGRACDIATSSSGAPTVRWGTRWSWASSRGCATSSSPTFCWKRCATRRSRRSSHTKSATSSTGTCGGTC